MTDEPASLPPPMSDRPTRIDDTAEILALHQPVDKIDDLIVRCSCGAVATKGMAVHQASILFAHGMVVIERAGYDPGRDCLVIEVRRREV